MQFYPNFHSLQPSADKSFEEIADIIRGDANLKSSTHWYQDLIAARHPDLAKQRKEDTPQIAVAFRMEGGRGTENCRECLGYTFVDFDAKDSRIPVSQSKLEQTFTIMSHSYHATLCYKSISGKGYHLIVPYTLPDGISIDMQTDPVRGAEIYKRVHNYVNMYYSHITGLQMDMQCDNVNRMVGLAHDDDAVYRPDAMPFKISRHELGIDDEGNIIKRSKPARKSGKTRSVHAEGNFAKAIEWLEKDDIVFMEGQRHDFLMRLSFLLNRMGVDQEEAATAIDAEYAQTYTEERPSKILASCYKHAQDQFGMYQKASTDGNGNKTTKTELIVNFLKGKPLRYDVISRKIQHLVQNMGASWTELTDRDINDLLCQCNHDVGENITSQTFRTVLNSNIIPAVNPLHEYLQSLPPWDESMPDSIDMAANMVHVGESQDLWRVCFKKWFVAMVASWLHEEIVNHQVLVLIGEQGIYKTTWLDKILPPELDAYRSKQTAMERLDKDEQLRAAEYALINLDEIDKLSERGLNELKSLITTTQIDVRAPYGYGKEKRIRLASYVASGNKEQFLTDQTGNRRWLPFLVESIDSPYENTLPYEGMYAQALYLLKSGFDYWFSLEDTRLMSPHVDSFMVETNEEQLLPVYFSPVPQGTPDAQCLTVAEISAKLTTYGNIRTPLGIRQLGVVLKKLGYEQVRDSSTGRRGYIVAEKSAEAVNAQRRILGVKS